MLRSSPSSGACRALLCSSARSGKRCPQRKRPSSNQGPSAGKPTRSGPPASCEGRDSGTFCLLPAARPALKPSRGVKTPAGAAGRACGSRARCDPDLGRTARFPRRRPRRPRISALLFLPPPATRRLPGPSRRPRPRAVLRAEAPERKRKCEATAAGRERRGRISVLARL